mmetsp:Transcript_21524/g.49444  ORF Transcript_21524/g.49444 Transcript_21524/m.49444 type:complete len:299 (+) Transcript_21524:644-1540(+)
MRWVARVQLPRVQHRTAGEVLAELGHRYDQLRFDQLVDPRRRLVLQLDFEYGERKEAVVLRLRRLRQAAAPAAVQRARGVLRVRPQLASLVDQMQVGVESEADGIGVGRLEGGSLVDGAHGRVQRALLDGRRDLFAEGEALGPLLLGESASGHLRPKLAADIDLLRAALEGADGVRVDGEALLARLDARLPRTVRLALDVDFASRSRLETVPPHPKERRHVLPRDPLTVQREIARVEVQRADPAADGGSVVELGVDSLRVLDVGAASLERELRRGDLFGGRRAAAHDQHGKVSQHGSR